MKDITIKSLAAERHVPIDRLIQQFADVGIYKTAIDSVSQHEKEILQTYLSQIRNITSGIRQLEVQRKTHSTLNVSGIGGKNKPVQIEIRKKRIYVQNNLCEEEKNKSEELLPKEQQYDAFEKEVYKIKNSDKEKNKNKITETIKKKDLDRTKSFQKKSAKSIQQKNSILIVKSQKTAEKVRLKAETTQLRNKVEEEIRKKVEENAQRIEAETRRMAKEFNDHWNNTLEKIIEEDSKDYHITTSFHAREAEDENDRKVEGERRSRFRNGKTAKQKKTSRLFENSKIDREETRVVNRGIKNKRKTNTIVQEFSKPIQAMSRNIVIGETITVAELANRMAIKSSFVIKALMQLGIMVTINQLIDQKTAQLIAKEMGHKVTLHHEGELEESVMSDRDIGNSTCLERRAPVVTIMGHVDHGKTSLLDYIRSSKIASSEAGGITQHIGAYCVETNNGMITFLDTPGHMAFTAMRARGAQITDIIVLVVSADDGVMPQTIEAIQHAVSAKVPIIVAINKIDKMEANPDRVKKELIQHGILPEEWGGKNQFVLISAKFGTGINELLEAILLQAEVLELKAVHNGMANGIVIESSLDKGLGPVATVLIRDGSLNQGDVVLCGFEYGRIRAMRNEIGHSIFCAGPSIPVAILGLSGVPIAGDILTVIRNEKKAREVALYRQGKFREIKLAHQKKSKLENAFSNMNDGEDAELNIVLKSDVRGTVEAISDTLKQLSNEKIKINIIGSGVGNITETDAMLAAASSAILLGFNVQANSSARRIVEKENLDLRFYSIIYHLIDEIEQLINGMLTPKYRRKIIGLAEIRNIFHSPRLGSIVGCMVVEGTVKRHNKIRILRKHKVIYEGELESLRRFKDDVNEVCSGKECGIGIRHCNNLRTGDIIEVCENTAIRRTII